MKRILKGKLSRKWKIVIGVLAVVLLAGLVVLICDGVVSHAANGRLYNDVASVPHRKVGLVLGTSPFSTHYNRRNHYFDHRITAAADLYNAGKVDWLVVSGGDYTNKENGYDEPVAMRDSLIKKGVDSLHIILDYDGTRTLNSLAKMRDGFHQDSIIIISQQYHNERALYQARHLGIDAIAFNAKTPKRRRSRWRNRGREALARVKLFIDIVRGVQPENKHPVVQSITADSSTPGLITVSQVNTKYGDLICLKPDMQAVTMDMVCGEIPSADDRSILLAFAGPFTGTAFDMGHANIAGDHVAGGKLYKGYTCQRNSGCFTWSPTTGPQFLYKDYAAALEKAEKEGGMGFGQEMMIHNGAKVKTTRPTGNKNVFRALCLDADNELALYESGDLITFGNFIDALHSQGVKEALYTDMGPGWNYCFYRLSPDEKTPHFLHSHSIPYSSNFIVVKA